MGILFAIWWLVFVVLTIKDDKPRRGGLPYTVYPAVVFLALAVWHWTGRRFGMLAFNGCGALVSMIFAWSGRIMLGRWL